MATFVEKVVLDVRDGWVHFGAAPGGEPEFRRTTETHALVTGRKAQAGDAVRFKAHGNVDGTTDYYYVEDKPGAEGKAA